MAYSFPICTRNSSSVNCAVCKAEWKSSARTNEAASRRYICCSAAVIPSASRDFITSTRSVLLWKSLVLRIDFTLVLRSRMFLFEKGKSFQKQILEEGKEVGFLTGHRWSRIWNTAGTAAILRDRWRFRRIPRRRPPVAARKSPQPHCESTKDTAI